MRHLPWPVAFFYPSEGPCIVNGGTSGSSAGSTIRAASLSRPAVVAQEAMMPPPGTAGGPPAGTSPSSWMTASRPRSPPGSGPTHGAQRGEGGHRFVLVAEALDVLAVAVANEVDEPGRVVRRIRRTVGAVVAHQLARDAQDAAQLVPVVAMDSNRPRYAGTSNPWCTRKWDC